MLFRTDNATRMTIGVSNTTFTHDLISTSGNISGSITSTGSFGLILQKGETIAVGQNVGTTDDVTFNNITATGNISGSSTSTGSFGNLLVNGAGVSRVGIGTKTPSNQLHIKNTSGDNRGLMVENTVASSYAELQVKASKEFRIGTGGSSTSVANQFYVYDATSGVHRFDIDTDGNIGIGTTDPAHRLDVRKAGETIIQAKATSAGRAKLHLDAYNEISEIYFNLTGANKGAIYQESDGTKLNVYGFAGVSYGYEIMTWKYSDGRVGIKQHDPEYDLDVTGTGRFTDDLRVEGKIYCNSNDTKF
jgi:hypothetical protein